MITYSERKKLVIKTSVKQPSGSYSVLPEQLEHKQAIDRMWREGHVKKQNGQYLLAGKAIKQREVKSK